MTEAAHGPTVLRILLGTHLRRLRESRGISAQHAAKVIRGSESKISRIELGRNAIREIDILDLLTYYGVDRAEREQMLALAEQANRPGWWHRHTDILPEWFQTYVGMEESAASIRIYEPQFVPGLLQTEDYAGAVLALGDFSPEETERHVLVRKERQRRFASGELKLWVIIEEPALRRPVSVPAAARASGPWQMCAVGLSASAKCRRIRWTSGSLRMYSGARPPGTTTAAYSDGSTSANATSAGQLCPGFSVYVSKPSTKSCTTNCSCFFVGAAICTS
jgi:transcriptional regulator with XRE-family HTH domain